MLTKTKYKSVQARLYRFSTFGSREILSKFHPN